MPTKIVWQRLACALAAALACAAASGADSPAPPAPLALAGVGFALKLPTVETVMYRGMVNLDNAGGAGGGMLYPGMFGVVGFLAAVATHGVIVEASKNSEKAKLQEAADKVLEPYKDALDGFSNRELMQRGIAKLSMAGPKRLIEPADAGEGWVVESAPVFTMTQDQSALVLENAISIYPANAPSSIRYQNIVKVVSNASAAPQPPWGADQGKLLKEESAAMFAHSINVMLHELAKAPSAEAQVHKTFRYAEGSTQKIERAQLVGELCDRAVIKTLRGWLMSIPIRRNSDEAPTEQCKNADRYPA